MRLHLSWSWWCGGYIIMVWRPVIYSLLKQRLWSMTASHISACHQGSQKAPKNNPTNRWWEEGEHLREEPGVTNFWLVRFSQAVIISDVSACVHRCLKAPLHSCIISPSLPAPSVLNCIGRWIFWHLRLSKSQPPKTLCTATPGMEVRSRQRRGDVSHSGLWAPRLLGLSAF